MNIVVSVVNHCFQPDFLSVSCSVAAYHDRRPSAVILHLFLAKSVCMVLSYRQKRESVTEPDHRKSPPTDSNRSKSKISPVDLPKLKFRRWTCLSFIASPQSLRTDSNRSKSKKISPVDLPKAVTVTDSHCVSTFRNSTN